MRVREVRVRVRRGEGERSAAPPTHHTTYIYLHFSYSNNFMVFI